MKKLLNFLNIFNMKKDTYFIILFQIFMTLIILAFLRWGANVSTTKSTTSKTGSDSTSISAINALSARLGQVQVDLNQIKSKIGVYQPSATVQQK